MLPIKTGSLKTREELTQNIYLTVNSYYQKTTKNNQQITNNDPKSKHKIPIRLKILTSGFESLELGICLCFGICTLEFLNTLC
jgi:hypothetical protein